jgi:hypothetical protein
VADMSLSSDLALLDVVIGNVDTGIVEICIEVIVDHLLANFKPVFEYQCVLDGTDLLLHFYTVETYRVIFAANWQGEFLTVSTF